MVAGDGGEAGFRSGMSLLDVAPSLQSLLGIDAPVGQRGHVLV